MSKVKLGEVAIEHKETCRGSKDGYPIVGLEHLIPEEVTLTAWNENSENTFTKMFRKGNVLFGRRRAYLKKAAVAPFDGICSGDITVIEALPDRILPELLPFIIQNDDLFDFAVGKSAGSLSPRVKWEHLKNYEFELPDMDKQRELAELLWAMDATKKSYQKLIAATDELVKSQFMELFGNPITNDYGWDSANLPDVAEFVLGSTPKSSEPDYWDGDVKWITPAELADNTFEIYDSVRHITEAGVKAAGLKSFPAGTVIFSTRAPIGKTAIAGCEMYCNQGFKNFICGERLNPVYLFSVLRIYKDYFVGLGTGATFKELSKARLEKISISIPPLALQNKFEAFYRQNDKSKFAVLSCSNLNLSGPQPARISPFMPPF